MNTGSEKLAGHAYAPGFEPGTVAAFLERMGESGILPFAVAALACCVLAALLAPGRDVTRRRRKRREADEARPLTPEELSERLRAAGVIQ
ncbi:MAG: hypothetical protein AAGG09_12505 [Pseudomonadota bacterium]